MPELILKIVKWSAVIAFFAGMVLSFISLLVFAIGLISTGLDTYITGDILAIIQIWLPFNLVQILGWVITSSALYLTFRISLFVYNHAARFLEI